MTNPFVGTQFEKLSLLLGPEGLERLKNAHVLVLGCGGVGSNCIEALGRGGVGKLTVVDRDVVSESNINRQAIAFHSTIGQRKVDVMKALLEDINPQIQVTARHEFVLEDNLEALFSKDYDYAIDAIDTISTKLALAKYAQEHDIPLISSMGGANKLDPLALSFADIHKTVNCPMCRIIRKEARYRGIKHLQVLYSCEQDTKRSATSHDNWKSKGFLGTMSYMPPIMGQMIASFVIRKLLDWEV